MGGGGRKERERMRTKNQTRNDGQRSYTQYDLPDSAAKRLGACEGRSMTKWI